MGKLDQVACLIIDSNSSGQAEEQIETVAAEAAAASLEAAVVVGVGCVVVAVVLVLTRLADIVTGGGHDNCLDPFLGIPRSRSGGREDHLGVIARPKHHQSLPSISMPFVMGQKSARL